MAEHIAFNGDRHIRDELQRLITRFGIRSIIETGTWSGGTTRTLRTMVDGKVTTLDTTTEHLLEDHGPGAVQDLEAQGVTLVLGDSKDTLGGVLAGHGPGDHPILVYIDSHGPDCPIIEELDALTADPLCRDRVVVAIHDVIVPGQSWGYNTVEWPWSGGPQPLGYEVLKHKFPAIWPHGYEYWYNDEAEGCQRGILYCVPYGGGQ